LEKVRTCGSTCLLAVLAGAARSLRRYSWKDKSVKKDRKLASFGLVK
jgi:hypothetical protein